MEELKLAIYSSNNYNFNSDVEFVLNNEEYMQTALNDPNFHVDRECKKVVYKGNLYSIDGYGNFNKDEYGLFLDKNKLELIICGETAESSTLNVTMINIDGDISWSTSDATIATVENGNVVPKQEGEAIITAACSEYVAKCKVKVEKILDDDYVEYEVEYNDVYSGKKYTKNTGWRLISQKQNEDGTYDIEFISSGIPVKLSYGWYEILNAIWKPDASTKNEYVNKFYNSASSRNATYAAAGLYYNFEKIVFGQETPIEYNYGYYRNITKMNNQKMWENASGEIKGDFFIIHENSNVRNVCLSDILGHDKIEGEENITLTSYNSGTGTADPKKGLYRLGDYDTDNRVTKIYYLSNPCYIDTTYHMRGVKSNGSAHTSNGGREAGLRPVITMKNVNMIKNGYIWKIIEN